MRPRRRSPISRGMTNPHAQSAAPLHGTTILSALSEDKVVIIGDGQVSMGQTVMKPNARKVRRLHDGSVIGGFAGAPAAAFPLFNRLPAKPDRHTGPLPPPPAQPSTTRPT